MSKDMLSPTVSKAAGCEGKRAPAALASFCFLEAFLGQGRNALGILCAGKGALARLPKRKGGMPFHVDGCRLS